jgi:hypothetical protein
MVFSWAGCHTVVGRRSADQRLTAPSSPQTLVYMRPFLSCPHHPQPTPPPPSSHLASLLPPPPARATPPAQPRHRHGPLRRHSRVAPLLPPSFAPHLVARSNDRARSGGGGSGPPARPPSRCDFLAASRCGSGGWCGGLLPTQSGCGAAASSRRRSGGGAAASLPVWIQWCGGLLPVRIRWWCGGLPPGAPSLSRPLSLSVCGGAGWWRRRVVVVAAGGGGGGWCWWLRWWQCRWRWWWRGPGWPAGGPAARRVFLVCEILSAESHLCSRHMYAERIWRGSRQRSLCRLGAAEWPLPRTSSRQRLCRGENNLCREDWRSRQRHLIR